MGSNRGDRAALLSGALGELKKGLASLSTSSIYRTTPRYVLDQADFFNLVVRGSTALSPLDLLAWTQGIEASFGRDRSRELFKGPRTLDIDILLYGDSVIDTPDLAVPHPGMLERAFVLVPLAELAPELRHPVNGRLFSSFIPALDGQGIYLFAKAPL